MKKFFMVSLIFSLILFTALIKNSTKRIDDEIFATKETIKILENEIEDLKLEYNFLSSGNKLMELKFKFFEEDFDSKSTSKIKFFLKNEEKIIIKDLKIYNSD
tara:strand:- start:712 stop:1020 length:309 start_codon:yes stop_codon:yes gene_type:complete